MHASGTQLRQTLFEKGLLVDVGEQLRLTEDYVFGSPSMAAMMMLGRRANGRVQWKTVEGQTLKELQIADSGDEPLG